VSVDGIFDMFCEERNLSMKVRAFGVDENNRDTDALDAAGMGKPCHLAYGLRRHRYPYFVHKSLLGKTL
jgi:hypothetical protein